MNMQPSNINNADNQVAELLTEEKVSEIKLALRNEPEVQKLAQSIDEKDQIQILEFGKEPATQISKFSDKILNNMRTTKVEDSGELLKQLGRIMDKFDKKDFEDASKGFFGKLFKKAKRLWKNFLGNISLWDKRLIKYMLKYRNIKMKWLIRRRCLMKCMSKIINII